MVLLLVLVWNGERVRQIGAAGGGSGTAKGKRQMHPHSPQNCPACCGADSEVQSGQRVVPWAEQKSKRGRPKTVETDGYSCNNPDCVYYNITDSNLHALVGYGKHVVPTPFPM